METIFVIIGTLCTVLLTLIPFLYWLHKREVKRISNNQKVNSNFQMAQDQFDKVFKDLEYIKEELRLLSSDWDIMDEKVKATFDYVEMHIPRIV